MTTMRAKFVVTRVEQIGTNEKLHFSAVAKSTAYDATGNDDDNTYAHYSPAASCEIYVANPVLHGKFKAGDKFYVDFTPAQ